MFTATAGILQIYDHLTKSIYCNKFTSQGEKPCYSEVEEISVSHPMCSLQLFTSQTAIRTSIGLLYEAFTSAPLL
jgi:hypothetical protein